MTYGVQELSGANVGGPPEFLAGGRYEVRLAMTAEEIEAALKLRFEVFNLELNEGLAASYETGQDRDAFDATCEHLIALDRFSGQVVGTYRLTTIEMTGGADRFYSASEYALGQLPSEVLAEGVEIGRACIAPAHRNKQVLFLLWRALIAHVVQRQKRYLFGCCSLTSQHPADGWELWEQFTEKGHLHSRYYAAVQPEYQCAIGSTDATGLAPIKIPRLLDSYLGMGAKVCSPPALDRQFGTIDFLVLLDVQNMHPRAQRLFAAELERG
jgi:putative hemolysin